MRGIIWYAPGHEEQAFNKLKIIIGDYVLRGHQTYMVNKNHHTAYVDMDNNDQWLIVPAKESQRGRKCDISYVDMDIDSDFFRNVIYYSTCSSPSNHSRQIFFWNQEHEFDNYIIKEIIEIH